MLRIAGCPENMPSKKYRCRHRSVTWLIHLTVAVILPLILAVVTDDVPGGFLRSQPESYLELITAFKTSLAAKREEISAAKKRYEVGLEKLAFATESVNAMQVLYLRQGSQRFSSCSQAYCSLGPHSNCLGRSHTPTTSAHLGKHM